MVMVRDRPAAEIEFPDREIAVFLWIVAIERQRQLRDVARRRHLRRVGQPGGVAVDGAGHPDLARLVGHLAGKGPFAAGHALGEHRCRVVGRARHQPEDQVLHLDLVAGMQAELGRRPACRIGRDRQILVETQPPGMQRLEGQIEGHHLGQRGRIGDLVGVDLAQYPAGIDVDYDRFADQIARHRCGMARQMLDVPACLRLDRDEDQASDKRRRQSANNNPRPGNFHRAVAPEARVSEQIQCSPHFPN